MARRGVGPVVTAGPGFIFGRWRHFRQRHRLQQAVKFGRAFSPI
jgi:hypothetical protein